MRGDIKTATDNELRRRADVLYNVDHISGPMRAFTESFTFPNGRGAGGEWDDRQAIITEIVNRGLEYRNPKMDESLEEVASKEWW